MLTAALIALTTFTALTLPVAADARLPVALFTVAALPAEPGAVVLTDAPTAQAVVADLDGDGAREIVALTVADDGSVAIEGWSEAGDRWTPIGIPVPVPPEGAQPGLLRLIVRDTSDGERVTLARQPLVPGATSGEPCCLHLEDVVVDAGRLRSVRVIDPLEAVDALFAIDLDGDGTDELFTSRSLLPLGDVSYPTATTVLRWDDAAFDPPVAIELPVGSGDTPFVLGETDGVPGEELGILATIGRPAFHRVALEGPATLSVEDARLVPLPADVIAVPLGDGREGIALLSDDGVLEVREWPADEPIGEPIARTRTRFAGSLLGSIDVGGGALVALRQASGADALHLRQLPALTVPPGSIAPVGLAAPAFGTAPVLPYVGPLPGGGPTGGPALVVAGRLVGATEAGRAAVDRIGLLAGAAPVGLAGTDGSWLAIHHLPAVMPPDPSGGRLDLLRSVPGSGLTVAPLGTVITPELEGATFTPPTTGGIPGETGSLAVGPSGFRAEIEAPPGSRIHVAGLDPTVVAAVVVVGSDGRVDVPMVPPVTGIPNPRYRAALSVTTPAGHAYVATWDVRVSTEPPPIDAAVTTPLGSGTVVVRGSTDAGSTVTIDGRSVRVEGNGSFEAGVPAPPWPTDVVVEATDPFGSRSRQVLSAVGFLDYRTLPWVAIVAAGLAAVAVLLAIRVPQRAPPSRRADDDAALEELDAD